MTSHHDVAGVVARAKTKAALLRMGEPVAYGSDAAAIEDLLVIVESQAKALSEAERTSCGDWASQRENDALTIEMYNWKARALAAEARLAEAMKVIEPFTRYQAVTISAGFDVVADVEVDYAVGVNCAVDDQPQFKHFEAARAFTNAAKEKT